MKKSHDLQVARCHYVISMSPCVVASYLLICRPLYILIGRLEDNPVC